MSSSSSDDDDDDEPNIPGYIIYADSSDHQSDDHDDEASDADSDNDSNSSVITLNADLIEAAVEERVFDSAKEYQYLPRQVVDEMNGERPKNIMQFLRRYLSEEILQGAREREQLRMNVLALYQPCDRELCSMNNAQAFFTPSFLQAIREGSMESIRRITTQIFPGIYTFEMFRPDFCIRLMYEADHMRHWVYHMRSEEIKAASVPDGFGPILSDFGLKSMLNTMMSDYICPITKVLFPEIGGGSLDSQHSFAFTQGYYHSEEELHADESDISLSVFLGRKFEGGEQYFRGVRCLKHLESAVHPEEKFVYPHKTPGHAILHAGCHRHGAYPVVGGDRTNFVMWCKSSSFQELKKTRQSFPEWCRVCRVGEQEEKFLPSIHSIL